MPDRKFAADMGSWKRLGRRWITILSAMLCGNFCLIVWAVAGFGGSAPNSDEEKCAVAVGELCEDAIVTSEAARPEPALSEEKLVEVAGITATAESAKTGSLVKTEPQPKPPVAIEKTQKSIETEQQAATAAVKVIQDDVVPQVKDESSSAQLTEAGIVIVNPPTTGGTVHFVVEGEIYSLPAGTYCRFAEKNPQRVVFHKGDDESDVDHELETGLFAFAVGSAGWELVLVDSKDSQKVLRDCRLAVE